MDMKKVLAYVQGINENLGGLIDVLSENYETDGASYVDDEQKIKFVSLDEALKVLDDFGDNSESAMIGNSDYVLIYDAEKKIVIDGAVYLPAGYMVMKSCCGLQPIRHEETEKVLSALSSRMETLVCGKYRMQAYQLG